MVLIDTSSSFFIQAVTQLSHFFAGFAAVLFFAFLATVLTLRGEDWGLHLLYGGTLLVLAIAILKEVLLDPILEGDPFLWGGAVDLLFWSLGILAAFLIGLLLYRLAVRACRHSGGKR